MLALLFIGLTSFLVIENQQKSDGQTTGASSSLTLSSDNLSASLDSSSSSSSSEKKVVAKSQEAKQATYDQDYEAMVSLGLVYDYVNLSLQDTVLAFLAESGIDQSQIAFSYKNTVSDEVIAMNETQPMTAGSTYKLPLNMLVVDEVADGKLTLTEEFDITNTAYEYQGEHDSYVAAFGGKMTIPQMQEYSLVYSENTPAYALAERLGGMEKAYSMFGRYGESKGEIKTIQEDGNKTTTDYYIQVLEYLWDHQDKYADILNYLGQSFPEYYYHMFLPNLTIYQKPGYVREALNVDAIVEEETPYMVAIYTAGLGGTNEYSEEISNYGLYQLGQLAYVINEWHRVNMNGITAE
nr:serine hydrolase [Streptococcus loxodontisalivarius]